jgi:hypothetical protein
MKISFLKIALVRNSFESPVGMATAVPNARDEKNFAKQAEIQHSYRRTTSRTMAQPSDTANLLLVTCQTLANVGG